jgi:serine/threonine protein phosphatase 1
VIDRLIWLTQNFDTICLRGNHELMMTRSRTDKSERKMWLSVGGTQALASYAVGGRATLESVPEEHWEFMTKVCVDYYETDKHIFVHAGLEPDKLMVEQHEEHLFWEFLEHPINHLTNKIVVCGHTSQRSGIPLAWPKTWCIDTYAYATGWLTCLDVNTQSYWQANSLGQTRRGELEFEE